MTTRSWLGTVTLLGLLAAGPSAHGTASQIAADLDQGRQLLVANRLLTEALTGDRGACCWITVAPGYDGNHVVEARVYTTVPVERTLAAYVLVAYGYDTYSLDRAAVGRFYGDLQAHCRDGKSGENDPLVRVYYDDGYIECPAGEALLRTLPV